MVGGRPDQADVAEVNYTFSCTPNKNSYQQSFSTWWEEHSVKKVSYQTCYPIEPLPSGGWKLLCTADQGWAGQARMSPEFDVWTEALLEMELVKYSKADNSEIDRSTYKYRCGNVAAGVGFEY